MESFSDLFEQVLLLCKADAEMADVTYNLFFSDLKPVGFANDTAYLETTSEFKLNILTSKYLELMKNNFQRLLGFPVSVEITVKSAKKEEEEQQKPVFQPENRDKYTFENFVVGSGNKFAYAACQRVAKDPGMIYNPLFIYGRSGLSTAAPVWAKPIF